MSPSALAQTRLSYGQFEVGPDWPVYLRIPPIVISSIASSNSRKGMVP
jgi:hypothetical protein